MDELTLPHHRPQDPQQQQARGGPPAGRLLRIQVRERVCQSRELEAGIILKVEDRKKVDELVLPTTALRTLNSSKLEEVLQWVAYYASK